MERFLPTLASLYPATPRKRLKVSAAALAMFAATCAATSATAAISTDAGGFKGMGSLHQSGGFKGMS